MEPAARAAIAKGSSTSTRRAPSCTTRARDPGETQDLSSADVPRAAELRDRVGRYSTRDADADRLGSRSTARRSAGCSRSATRRAAAAVRRRRAPDPKDRRAIAARLSEVISGELQGTALEAALRRILADDPKNPQANLRLGFVLLESNRCAEATPFLNAAIAAKMPTADAHLGLGVCQAAARRPAEAYVTLLEAERVEPDNPVVFANLGIVLSDDGPASPTRSPPFSARSRSTPTSTKPASTSPASSRAPDSAQDAAREAQDLLTRLPANAPQRSEVQRLLDAVR